ncbi:uncharacterized protein [Montipora capricornis]
MVCECCDGSIQLWSLASGNLKWKRYVKPKHYDSSFRVLRMINTDDVCQPADFERSSVFRSFHSVVYDPRKDVIGFYRSVVFHPSKDVILPGELSHSFSFSGDLKPLFPTSKCSFSVCSICGDEMLSDCPDDAKCLVVWNLNDGKEINRFNTDKYISSFAMSRDGKLVAVSHSTGSVCLVDRESGFSTLAEASLPAVCGMIRFSPDSRFLFCLHLKPRTFKKFCLGVTEGPEHHYSMDVVDVRSCNSVELESDGIGGFLLGDPFSLPRLDLSSVVVLNSHSLLRNRTRERCIEMVYRNPPTKNPESRCFDSLLLSLTGERVYAEVMVFNGPGRRIMAYDVLNGEVKGPKECESPAMRDFVAVKQGILFATKSTLELWNFDLSVCMRRWMFGADALFSISNDQVACITFKTRNGIILDVVGGEIVETFKLPPGKLRAWHKEFQLFASTDGLEIELKQLGKTEPRWRFFLDPRFCDFVVMASFSPKGQFLLIDRCYTPIYVLDTISGKVRLKLSDDHVGYCKFISDEECVSLTSSYAFGSLLQLFNVRSGDLLVVMVVLGNASCLATSPRSSLIAIGSDQGLEIIKVKYPGEETLSSEAKKHELQE